LSERGGLPGRLPLTEEAISPPNLDGLERSLRILLAFSHTTLMESVETELQRRFKDAYDDNGVDRTLIRESLALTPAQRLADLECFLSELAKVQRVTPAK
jgi:hypothetical protein